MLPLAPQLETLAVTVAGFPAEAQQRVLEFVASVEAELRRQQAASNKAWDDALDNTTPAQAAKVLARVASQRGKASPLFDAEGKVAVPKS